MILIKWLVAFPVVLGVQLLYLALGLSDKDEFLGHLDEFIG